MNLNKCKCIYRWEGEYFCKKIANSLPTAILTIGTVLYNFFFFFLLKTLQMAINCFLQFIVIGRFSKKKITESPQQLISNDTKEYCWLNTCRAVFDMCLIWLSMHVSSQAASSSDMAQAAMPSASCDHTGQCHPAHLPVLYVSLN